VLRAVLKRACLRASADERGESNRAAEMH
jgi:hypothetical protein